MKLLQAGWTALMWACYKGRTDAASVLLRSGANPNVKGEVRSKSYLCFFFPADDTAREEGSNGGGSPRCGM